MKNFKVIENKNTKKIDFKKIIDLYLAAGWGKPKHYSENILKKAFKNTGKNFFAINEDKEIIGFSRVFSDNLFHTYIAEIVIHPAYQRAGVGKAIIDFIKNKYKGTGIYLESFKRNEQFFLNCGFKTRDMLVMSLK